MIVENRDEKRKIILVLFILSIAALMSACAEKDTKSEQNIYIAWSNNQESYSFISTLTAVEAAGAKPVVLEQALSADLSYDEDGELAGAHKDEQGIEYSNGHRDPKKETFVAHPVSVISKDSHLYEIIGKETIDNVPSWHHQAVENVENTRLVVTAQAETDNKPIIEGVERPDKKFCVGIQFHAEVAVRKHVEKEIDAESFMDYDTALSFFKALMDAR